MKKSLKRVIWGFVYGTTIRVIEVVTRSLDNGSYRVLSLGFRTLGLGV